MEGEPRRGWGVVVALALATAAFSVASPAVLIFLPLALMLLALPPHRPALILVGAALAAGAFLGRPADPMWYLERGWALMLGGWFVAAVLLLPRARFFPRALAAVAAALASAAIFLQWRGNGWSRLDWVVSRQVRDAAARVSGLWGGEQAASEWATQVSQGVLRVAELQILLHPALLAIASLAGLGVAWWAQRKLAARDGRPLGSLREFRFRDDLVWVLIAGILLMVLPFGEAAVRTGSNVLTFMGALYALRGAAVLLVLSGVQGLAGAVFATLAFLLLYPVVLAAAIVVGVTDTWFDLRARWSVARPDS